MAYGRLSEHVLRLTNSVFRGPGRTPAALRAAIGEAAARAVEAPAAGTPGRPGIPPPLDGYVESVLQRAYAVTDADVQRLTGAGHSDDEVFEATVAAAVGAGVSRLERAMRLLKGDR